MYKTYSSNYFAILSAIIYFSFSYLDSLYAAEASKEQTIDIPSSAKPDDDDAIDAEDWMISREIPEQVTIRVVEGTVYDTNTGNEIGGGYIMKITFVGESPRGAKWKIIAEKTANGEQYIIKFEVQDPDGMTADNSKTTTLMFLDIHEYNIESGVPWLEVLERMKNEDASGNIIPSSGSENSRVGGEGNSSYNDSANNNGYYYVGYENNMEWYTDGDGAYVGIGEIEVIDWWYIEDDPFDYYNYYNNPNWDDDLYFDD